MKERQKTNSITQLVKIVAEEVLNEQLEQKIAAVLNKQSTHIQKIRDATKNAGEHWTFEEDEIFVSEVAAAVEQLAENHKRTTGAIKARLKMFQTLGRI